jgi:hypothetical protein
VLLKRMADQRELNFNRVQLNSGDKATWNYW